MMRLAYVIGQYPAPSETFIAREVEGMRARGHQVHLFSLFTPTSGPADEVSYGWSTRFARFTRRIAPEPTRRALARRWRERFTAMRCDAIVAHFGSLPSTLALEASGDLPLIISLHARDLYVEADRLTEKVERAKAIVTCTQANRDYLTAQYPGQAERIHLLYHGLPVDWLEAPRPVRQRNPIEPLRVLAVGRFVEKKGFHTLVQAAAMLHEQRVPLRLRIIGDGPLRAQYLAEGHRRGLHEVLSLDPWMSQQALRDAFTWADLFCSPSIIAADGDRDGLPNVILEAMASGLPVVGSRLSGIPEAVEEGQTGLLVPPGDPAALAEAIARCRDMAWRNTLGALAAQRVRDRFTATCWLAQFETLLTQSINATL